MCLCCCVLFQVQHIRMGTIPRLVGLTEYTPDNNFPDWNEDMEVCLHGSMA